MSCNCSQPKPLPQTPNICGACHQTVYLRRYPTGCGCGQPKPQCKCHEPETPLCVPCNAPVCEPDMRPIKTRIVLSPDDAGACFPPNVCACDACPDITDLVVRVRRRGQCDWLLEYPAWDCSACGVEFLWDSQLHALPRGRYELAFFEGECPCGRVEMFIGKPCPVDTRSYKPLKVSVKTYPAEPEGIYPVFEEIASFTTTLCGVMEKQAEVVPLCQPAIDELCGVVLCRPVQLELSDGYNSELVTFTGCTGGAVVVARTAPRYKFAKGSTLRFVWSAANVAAACSPCP